MMKEYTRVIKYARPYIWSILFAILMSAIFAASSIYFMSLIRNLVQAISNKNFFHFNIYIIDIVGLYTIRLLSVYFQTYVMAYVSSRLTIDLRIELYTHIQGLSLDFFEKFRQGDIISRILTDINAIETVTKTSFTSALPQSLTLIGVVSYLSFINWKLTMIIFILLPLYMYVLQLFAVRMRKLTSKIQRKSADITSVLQESIAAVRVVKAFAMENHEIKRFARENERNFIFSMKNARVVALQEPVLAILQLIPIVFVIWFTGMEVILHGWQVDKLFAYITGIFLAVDPVLTLSRVYTQIQSGFASTERVFSILDTVPSVKEARHPIKSPSVTGEIEFKDISFAYNDKDGYVLKDINIKISVGETVALVGASGSGKSTFANLIPRFYDPQIGTIYIDGHELKKLSLSSFRRHIGIVPQETVLFRGSIENNIAYGRIEATRAEIIEAAKQANAHDFIMKMRSRYLTRVGDRGQRLSGGQRQRIAIARAILRNPKILILDEATSALDNESEKLVQDALEMLMKNRTTIIIAHRLSTIINADKILIFDNGKILEQGTHKELLQKSTIYKKLYKTIDKNIKGH